MVKLPKSKLEEPTYSPQVSQEQVWKKWWQLAFIMKMIRISKVEKKGMNKDLKEVVPLNYFFFCYASFPPVDSVPQILIGFC